MFTAQSLHNILADTPFKPSSQCWVAYSGGLDSHVLLHALCQCREIYLGTPKVKGINIKAIHVNHGLSPSADAWSAHCIEVCEALGVSCVVKHIDVQGALGGGSIEKVARDLRYEAFRALMQPGDYLLLAHHQDDLAETFLLQALRGAGPKGLASMPLARPFAEGTLLRPLLGISRTSLRECAQREGLVWLEDESNVQDRFDRNYLRSHIFPMLLERFPGVAAALSRGAKHCAEADALLHEMAEKDWVQCKGNAENTLSVCALLDLSIARQKNLLRHWIQQRGFLLPTTVKLETLRQTILLAQQDARPYLTWHGVEVRRYRDDLYIMSPLPVHDVTRVFDWDMSEGLDLPGIGKLEPSCVPASMRMVGTNWTVRFRRGGERIRLARRLGTHSLKKLFQEWGVPPWLRDRIPLVFHGEDLVMVVGYAVKAIDN